MLVRLQKTQSWGVDKCVGCPSSWQVRLQPRSSKEHIKLTSLPARFCYWHLNQGKSSKLVTSFPGKIPENLQVSTLCCAEFRLTSTSLASCKSDEAQERAGQEGGLGLPALREALGAW